MQSVWIAAIVFFVQGLPLIADDWAARPGRRGRSSGAAVVPLGLFCGGVLASWWGLRAVWVIAGCGFLAVFAVNRPAQRFLAGIASVPPAASNGGAAGAEPGPSSRPRPDRDGA